MVPPETSRRAFLLGASGLGTTDQSTVGATGQSAVGVPGIDTDHGIRWTFDTREEATVYPAVRTRGVVVTLVRTEPDEEMLYEVYAFDAETGETRWRRELDGHSTFPRAVDGTAYVPDGDRLLALDATDGSERWRLRGESIDFRSLAIGDRTVFAVDDARVTAVDATNGDERWTTEVGSDGRLRGPTLDGERVYLGGHRGFYALDRETGREQWNAETQPGERAWAAGVRNGLLVGWSEQAVYGLRVADGTRRWRTSHDDTRPFPTMGTVGDDTAYVWGQSLAAIDLRTGEKRWTFQTDTVRGNSPELHGGSVYFPTDEEFVALDADSGRERWRTDDRSQLGYWGNVVDGLVYVVGETGAAAIDAGSGRRRWTLDFENDRGLWADAAGDLALVGTRGGTLYAVDRPSALATAPAATAEQFATSPPGLGLFGLLGAGLLGVGYRQAKRGIRESDPDVELGRLDRLGRGPVTETYRKRVRTPDGPKLVAETRLLDGADAETRRAFAEAVERWADLDSDAVLPIRDYDVGPDGGPDTDSTPWFETPYVAGGSLADSWPIGDRERVEVASGVARTVHAAHREGVAHGRLVPRHVFVGVPSETPRARITADSVLVGGWFLADALAGVRDADDPYAPPERDSGGSGDSGDSGVFGVSDDVYRVGALAYHLLAGAVPSPDPTPASSRNRVLSEELDDVLTRALAADPGDRYDSALAFDDEFRWAALDR
ncbi:outer membrane protein assembly factor BamB family protein [Halorussus salinisoli]|uniref:outer membrane protein assembly factor BamB family protein n=1 Tax=Halorussus salinisoli TaxID=2558242 RepID=UPI0010C1D934|nr:PQQ-binding-like beta-propeller repeat protein [Halorussus salinisoli]